MEDGCRNRTCVEEGKDEPIGKKVMSCGNFLNHGDILLYQSQKEFNSYDLGEVSLSNFWKQRN
jgi:hypothetical protein